MKIGTLITLILLILAPQIHEAWGEVHCVSDCHETKVETHQSSSSEDSSHPDESSHFHSSQCIHVYALTFNMTLLPKPKSKPHRLVYLFVPLQSEAHLKVFSEPPILS